LLSLRRSLYVEFNTNGRRNMSGRNREGWDRHVNQVIRSQHYTWLGEGLGGVPLPEALCDIVADIMHICARQGMSWDELVHRGRAQYEREVAQLPHQPDDLDQPAS
jgi:hypothetical protein